MLASSPASRLLRLQFSTIKTHQRQQQFHISVFRSARTTTSTRHDGKDRIIASAADTVEAVKELKLVAGARCIPHPDKVSFGGEDAHFISSTSGGAFGVADGVGGWAESGINPADYSKGFMRIVQDYLEGKPVEDPEKKVAVSDGAKSLRMNLEPRSDLRGAFEAAHETLRVPGSCTACVLRLDKETQEFVGLNLGDSAFMIVRNGQIIFKTPPMQHFFDCPCQFGAYPEFVEATDEAGDAEQYTFKAKPGDIIVMGTDGLWDNCLDEEILEVLPSRAGDVEKSVGELAKLAYAHSLDDDYDSPYCQAAREEGYDLEWYEKLFKTKLVGLRPELGQLTGGKKDDITVVAAFVDTVPPMEPETSQENPEKISDKNSTEESAPSNNNTPKSGETATKA